MRHLLFTGVPQVALVIRLQVREKRRRVDDVCVRCDSQRFRNLGGKKNLFVFPRQSLAMPVVLRCCGGCPQESAKRDAARADDRSALEKAAPVHVRLPLQNLSRNVDFIEYAHKLLLAFLRSFLVGSSSRVMTS